MRETNIVFWLLVALALAGFWLLLSSWFKEVGEMLIDLFNEKKDDITEDTNEEE